MMTAIYFNYKKGLVEKMNNNEFFEALRMMEAEKGLPAEYIAEKISSAIIVAVKRDYNGKDVVGCDINVENGTFRVYLKKEVVEEIEDEDTQILPEEAKKYSASASVGDIIEIDLDTKQFGRIVAQTAKHVIRQGIREAEHGMTMKEFQSKHHELVTAQILRIDPRSGNATVSIGKSEAILPVSEQVEGEKLYEGQMIKVYIVDVRETDKGPKIMISRTHPGLVKRLFEMEVPEIFDGTIEVKSVSREAGKRTKIAVYSKDENVDAIGSCIGPKGARVENIINELGGEKIDIVKYSDDITEFIKEALSPANVVDVVVAEDGSKACQVTVPDHQLSLAIGNKGQNARLAAKLTGWKIDIRPESGFYGD
jgi:N utilization substance protein A